VLLVELLLVVLLVLLLVEQLDRFDPDRLRLVVFVLVTTYFEFSKR
jgi:hypothetical protein